MLDELLERSSWGAMFLVQVFAAASGIDRDVIVGVLVALIVAAIVGVVLWLVAPTRPYAGPAAILVFLVLLLLLLV